MITPEAADLLKQVEEQDIPAALAALRERIGATRLREGAEQAITAAGERRDWDTIIPLGEYNLPTFPVETFPPWMREMCEHLSIAMQTPIDLSAMLMLAAVATCCQKKSEIVAKRGWREPLNLYTVTVLGPANRKTPVCKAICKPIQEYERGEKKRLEPDLAEKKSRLTVLQSRLKEAENKAARASTLDFDAALDDVKHLSREVAMMPDPAEYRLLVDDATPEKLGDLLATNNGAMSVLTAEGDTFDILAGRYSQSANLGVYLKGYDGEELIVDRIGRKGSRVDRPALTIGMAVQPDIIQGLMSKPSLRGRGLLGRFLYSLPQEMLGFRDTNPPPVPDHIAQTYAAGIRALLERQATVDDWDRPTPHACVFDEDAVNVLIDYQTEIELSLRAGGDLGDITDWAGKLCGAVVRIAGILHQCDWAVPAYTPPPDVPPQIIDSAIAIGRYLTAHAKAAFAEMGADTQMHDAQYLLAWLQRNAPETVSLRDLQRAMKRRFKKIDDLTAPLALLEERNYLRVESPTEEERKHNGKGALRVNPAAFASSQSVSTPPVCPVVPVVPATENTKPDLDLTYLLTKSEAAQEPERAASSGDNGDNGTNDTGHTEGSAFDRGVEL